MNETGRRTITAAEAANSPELWQAVERGEVRVTMLGASGDIELIGLDDLLEVDKMLMPTFLVKAGPPKRFMTYSHEPLTVTAIPVAAQSENSPANVARLRARIAALEAAIRKVLDDEETGTGWGPDVTTAKYLREAMEAAHRPAADASEAPTPPDTSYKLARGIFQWQPGDEPAEVSVRRMRDTGDDAGRLDADDDGSGKDVR